MGGVLIPVVPSVHDAPARGKRSMCLKLRMQLIWEKEGKSTAFLQRSPESLRSVQCCGAVPSCLRCTKCDQAEGALSLALTSHKHSATNPMLSQCPAYCLHMCIFGWEQPDRSMVCLCTEE